MLLYQCDRFSLTLNNCSNVLVDSCVLVKVAFGVKVNRGTNVKINNNQGLNRYDVGNTGASILIGYKHLTFTGAAIKLTIIHLKMRPDKHYIRTMVYLSGIVTDAPRIQHR